MSHATLTISGKLLDLRRYKTESNRGRGLLSTVGDDKPGVILDVHGNKIEELARFIGQNVLVIGNAMLVDGSRQDGMNRDLALHVEQFIPVVGNKSVNHLSIDGHLGRDIEVKPDGDRTIGFGSIAVNHDADSVSWFHFTAFDRDAETLAKHSRKGSLLSLKNCALALSSRPDKATGEIRRDWKVIVRTLGYDFLEASPANASKAPLPARPDTIAAPVKVRIPARSY